MFNKKNFDDFNRDKSFTLEKSKFAVEVVKTVFPQSAVFSVEADNNFENTPPIIKALDRAGINQRRSLRDK